MFDWLFGRNLDDVVNETKKINVRGIRFHIRKINLLDHLDGAKVLTQVFDTHKTKGEKAAAIQNAKTEKIQAHLTDVFMAGVISPKLTRKREDPGVLVDSLFMDWGIAFDLYNEIMLHTYGKKKMTLATSVASDWLKSML